MKGLKIANEAAKMASEKEKKKKPGMAVVITMGKDKSEPKSCPNCGCELESEESEED